MSRKILDRNLNTDWKKALPENHYIYSKQKYYIIKYIILYFSPNIAWCGLFSKSYLNRSLVYMWTQTIYVLLLLIFLFQSLTKKVWKSYCTILTNSIVLLIATEMFLSEVSRLWIFYIYKVEIFQLIFNVNLHNEYWQC